MQEKIYFLIKILLVPIRPLASSPVNGRSGNSKCYVFSFLPFMGKGAHRADRGGFPINFIFYNILKYFTYQITAITENINET
jgi:hypothetical protein